MAAKTAMKWIFTDSIVLQILLHYGQNISWKCCKSSASHICWSVKHPDLSSFLQSAWDWHISSSCCHANSLQSECILVRAYFFLPLSTISHQINICARIFHCTVHYRIVCRVIGIVVNAIQSLPSAHHCCGWYIVALQPKITSCVWLWPIGQ